MMSWLMSRCMHSWRSRRIAKPSIIFVYCMVCSLMLAARITSPLLSHKMAHIPAFDKLANSALSIYTFTKWLPAANRVQVLFSCFRAVGEYGEEGQRLLNGSLQTRVGLLINIFIRKLLILAFLYIFCAL